jgi:BirA family biotin operon repressor/biotin-[acetyl-CoA-carboxylase] ligase
VSGTGGPFSETEVLGRPARHFQVAISAGAQALAWARQEEAPHGASVQVDREISPLGFRGRMWHAPAESTLACAVVLRPPLPAEEGDLSWLVGAGGAVEGAEAAAGAPLATWWPDTVVDAGTEEPVANVKAEVQLGPGRVRSAVVTLRFDLERLGLGLSGRDHLLESVLGATDRVSETLSESDGAAGIAEAYGQRCVLVGRRVKIRLLPRGETRGVVGRVDRTARLELRSQADTVEHVTIDMLHELQAV